MGLALFSTQGYRATSLRDMVGAQVLLSVPKVNLVSRDTAIRTLGENEVSPLVGIHQVFEAAKEFCRKSG